MEAMCTTGFAWMAMLSEQGAWFMITRMNVGMLTKLMKEGCKE